MISLLLKVLCIFPAIESVAEYNTSNLHNINRPIATIKAVQVHSGINVSKMSSEDAGGLDPNVDLAYTTQVM